MPAPAGGVNEYWAMVPQESPFFVHDQFVNGLALGVVKAINGWSRENALLEISFRLTGQCVFMR